MGNSPSSPIVLLMQNIDRLQQYYGNAICANVGHIDAMEHACWAVLYYSCSHDADPQYEYYDE